MSKEFITGSRNLSFGAYSKNEATCPICGKVFRPAVENVFWVKIDGKKTDICGPTALARLLKRDTKSESRAGGEAMMTVLKEWESRIEKLLCRHGVSIGKMPGSYEPSGRAWARREAEESGMLILDYVYRLRVIISTLEFALRRANARADALMDIVKRSENNCEHCKHTRESRMRRCDEIDYDCVICKEGECPCRHCADGSGFVWDEEEHDENG